MRHRANGLVVYQQQFRFPGRTADELASALTTAPLIGASSVFGERSGATVVDLPGTDEAPLTRTVHNFPPAPGFRFDVTICPVEDRLFTVTFAQPDRTSPYLSGVLLWLLEDSDGGALLTEDINTERSLEFGPPVTGTGFSVRRWLFFTVGHKKVMDLAMDNLARLAASVESESRF